MDKMHFGKCDNLFLFEDELQFNPNGDSEDLYQELSENNKDNLD